MVAEEHPARLRAPSPRPPPARGGGVGSVLLGPASLLMVLTLVAPLALLLRDSLNRFDPTELMLEAITPETTCASSPMRSTGTCWSPRSASLSSSPPSACCSACRWHGAGAHRQPLEVGLVVLMVLPLFVGSTTRTAGWMILFAHGGMLDMLTGLNLMYAEPAVIAGIIAINLPYTVLTLQSVFEGIDPRLEEAAASMGAAPSRAFWRVVFPLALPGISIAAVLCFILCMNAFATPVLLGGPRFQMMAPLLFWAFNSDNNWPFAAAIAFILMATTLLLTGIANHMIPRRYRGLIRRPSRW